ncbi:hypothetical protein FQZ97_1067330 [compost metagenome]
MALDRPARDGQAQAMAGARLVGRAEEGLAQLRQVFRGNPGAVVAHADQQAAILFPGAHLHRLALRIEAQGIAQQIVQRPLQHVRPAFELQVSGAVQAHLLFRCQEPGILPQLVQQRP